MTSLWDNPNKAHQRKALARQILQRDGHVCAYCGGKATAVDHIVARKDGGTDSPDNLTACCTSCNTKKENQSRKKGIFSQRNPPACPPLGFSLPTTRFDPPVAKG